MPKINIGVAPKDVALGFPLPKPGTYPVSVKFLEMKKTKEAKKDMAIFGFTPLAPVPCTTTDEAGSTKDIDVAGKELWKMYCVLTPESIFSLRQLQVATNCTAGWDDSGIIDTDQFVQFNGKQLRVVTEHELDNNNKTQSRIVRMMPA